MIPARSHERRPTRPKSRSAAPFPREEVVAFYVDVSARARAGQLRNADPQLAKVMLTSEDVAPLAAFLRALTEDYE